jgi:peroxiredoxin
LSGKRCISAAGIWAPEAPEHYVTLGVEPVRRARLLLFPLLILLLPLKAANIPRPAGEYKIKTAVGELALSQYKGKIVVLEFLLTTCPACKRCSSTMEKLYKEFAGRGVQMLGVAVNEGADKLVRQYVSELGLTYPVGYGDYRAALAFLQHPEIVRFMVPQLVFIDRAGVIRAQYPGTDAFFNNEEENMRRMIQSLLKPASGKKK